MSGDPVLLLAAHPTRGVDVGAQAQIWDALRTARAEGLAVLLISADLDELIGLSDTIEVILRGRMVGTADPRTVTPEELGSAMTGAGEAAEPAEHGPAGGRHAAGTVAVADSEDAGRHLAPGPDPVPVDSGPGADPDLDVPLPGTAGPGLTGTGTTGTGDLANDPDAGGEERP
jgi:simple sugar transport system ATP-binding protein